jgi:excisionase family DNA binding protein
MADRLMTTQEVSSYLGVPVGTLYQWRLRGEGPRAVRVGRHLRFRFTDLNRWIDQHADEPRMA